MTVTASVSGMPTLLLQLVRWLIGWHFLYEGLWKLLQTKGWSGLSYLDNAQGPLAGLFKWMASPGWLVAIGDQTVMWGLVLIGISLITGVLVLAVFSGLVWRQYRARGFEQAEAVTSATVKVYEFTALAALKEPLKERVELAGVKVSPLTLGGDLMAGRSHASDLIWTDEFMVRYHRGGSLERLVRYCSLCGVDPVFAPPSFCARIRETAASVGRRCSISC